MIECIPNFSDGRNPAVLAKIVAAIQQAGGTLLNYSADADHNRSVVTFVATPELVEDCAFAAIYTAATLIDLDQQSGTHPRIGATDVFPLVPLDGVSIAECVAICQQIGARVSQQLGIPIYLYEHAHPQRRTLPEIRRGGYETLKQIIGTDPSRKPDFGPAQLGKAGATVLGVRDFLVAYNIYLNTSDVRVAERIAKAVRYSSGGLRNVRALGMLVGGQAQVSLNLTNPHQTPLHRVLEFIRREAAQHGVTVARSELIGMLPQAALLDSAAWYLQLPELPASQILEWQIQHVLQVGETQI